MTEQEWLDGNDPQLMLDFLFTHASYSERKMRLFAVACYWQVSEFHWDEPLLEAEINAIEQYADELISRDELRAVSLAHYRQLFPNEEDSALRIVELEADYAMQTAEWAADLARSGGPHGEERSWPVGTAEAKQAHLLRDLFGNPFRPESIDLSWLTWNDQGIPKLARAIYDERRFEDLFILAHALEQAGCTNHDILVHFRDKDEHARGCWLLDLLLNRS
jgi:predicted nucleic acid-binding protein